MEIEKIEVNYEENGKFESLIIYGKENYFTFMDENLQHISIISIKNLWRKN